MSQCNFQGDAKRQALEKKSFAILIVEGSVWLRVTQTQSVGKKVENLLVYSALVTLGSFIIIITFFIRTGLRFWDCLWLSHHPYIPIWTLFVLTNAYLFLSAQNMWESCVKWIMRTWDTWSTKQWICVQEEWGRCTGTSFLSVCKHSFFFPWDTELWNGD